MNTYVEADFGQNVAELFAQGTKPTEIARELSLTPWQVYNVLKHRGLYEPKPRGKKKEIVACPHCKAENNPKGAKYCCMCGSDIRPVGIRTADSLQKICRNIAAFFPTNEVDPAMKIIADAQKVLRNI